MSLENSRRSWSSSVAPCDTSASFSISPNRCPPSRCRPSTGCIVCTCLGPRERACHLSVTMCFSFWYDIGPTNTFIRIFSPVRPSIIVSVPVSV